MKLTRSRSFIIATTILAVGVGGLALLVALRPEPPRQEAHKLAPLVTTASVQAGTDPIFVRGTGTVVPTRQVTLVAETSGKIVTLSPRFVTGGAFTRGALLAQIDPSDYENAVAVAEAEVVQRHFDLIRAREEAGIAREEWERLSGRTGAEQPAESELGSLVLKEPQLRLAEAALRGAEARLADATNRLERTHVVAPFDGRVRSENVDVGQVVGPGQQIGVVYSTHEVEIAVSLTTQEAALIEDLWTARRGVRIPARVHAEFGGVRHSWDASVDRAEGAIDPGTRTINVVVRIRNPYRPGPSGRPPLLVGTFAEVDIQATETMRYVVVPVDALREGETVWVVADGRLHVMPVEIIQEVEDRALIRNGLSGDERVVVSALPVMADGMAVRVAP